MAVEDPFGWNISLPQINDTPSFRMGFSSPSEGTLGGAKHWQFFGIPFCTTVG